ncbi:lipopolysaccharide biosynthesis protein [Tabrizicola sp. WMC-M-20]|nr:lipopolysaccharide biosynthesis protein [Tabrizicola sp. WMC-M-20]
MAIKFYLSLFVRRLPYFLLLLALGAAIGGALATLLPPVYQTQARLLVESEQIPGNLAASTVQIGAGEKLEIIQQRILTRNNLIDMANRLFIYGDVSAARRQNPDEIVADMRKRIDIRVTGGRSGTQATIVSVSFRAPQAQMSATVVNELVTLILREDVAMRTGSSGQTLDFFTQDVQRLDQELSRIGGQLLAFKTQNQTALPDSLDFRRRQQALEQDRIVQLDRDRALLNERRTRLVTLYETTGRVELASGRQLTAEERQLQTLQDELGGLMAVLSPTNPRVTILQGQIAALETRITMQAGAGAGADDAAGLTAYEIQLADLDGQIAAIDDQKARSDTRLAELQTSIDATPRNAIALDSLERDYTNVREQYNQAVANRARAETGDLIESLSKGGRISVLEQAVVPRAPASPNRPLIAAAGVGGGFALGLALVVMLEMLNTAIRRPVDLTAKLGISPFATLPYMRTRIEIRHRRTMIAVALVAVAVCIPAGLWAVQTYVMPLDLLLEQILRRLTLA